MDCLGQRLAMMEVCHICNSVFDKGTPYCSRLASTCRVLCSCVQPS